MLQTMSVTPEKNISYPKSHTRTIKVEFIDNFGGGRLKTVIKCTVQHKILF